ncbi:MAG: hypothetical protein JWP44_4507 [Mucilaginibacter sp.]|nr:hypothetical protein [Mucilaginibacter sp.]
MNKRLEWPRLFHIRRGTPRIECDRCETIHSAPFPCGVILARARFAENGWRQQDGCVLCPDCAAKVEQSKGVRRAN